MCKNRGLALQSCFSLYFLKDLFIGVVQKLGKGPKSTEMALVVK